MLNRSPCEPRTRGISHRSRKMTSGRAAMARACRSIPARVTHRAAGQVPADLRGEADRARSDNGMGFGARSPDNPGAGDNAPYFVQHPFDHFTVTERTVYGWRHGSVFVRGSYHVFFGVEFACNCQLSIKRGFRARLLVQDIRATRIDDGIFTTLASGAASMQLRHHAAKIDLAIFRRLFVSSTIFPEFKNIILSQNL